MKPGSVGTLSRKDIKIKMNKEEFIQLIGKDIVVDYPFYGEIQKYNMMNFYIDDKGKIYHKWLPFIMDIFIQNARNPHIGKATHG